MFVSRSILLLFGLLAAGGLFSQELPRPTLQNAMIVSLEHPIYDSSEIDYLKATMPYGLYAWPSFSITALGVPLDWHAALSGADAGIQSFKNTVEGYLAQARAKNVRLHLVVTSGLARSLSIYREAKEEDIRNAMWYNDNKLAADSQISSPELMSTYVFGTFSRYARKMRANLEAKAHAALAFLKEKFDDDPETLIAVSGWGELEMNYRRISDNGVLYFGDYSPFAVLEFRDWIRHTGLYDDSAGLYAGQGYAQGGARYQGASGLSQFNADFGTAFTSWSLRYYDWSLGDDHDLFPQDYANNDPRRLPFGSYAHGAMMPTSGPSYIVGGFDPPRTIQTGNAFWDLWNLFRETLVANFVGDMARWVSEAGIDPGRWYSHQIPGDYIFGTSPDTPFKNERYYTSASTLRSADFDTYGSLGATIYDSKFPAAIYPPVFARTSQYALAAMAQLSANWGIMEYDPETYPLAFPIVQSDVDALLEQYLRPYDLGAHMINFWRWEDTLEHQIKGMNKELALREFIRRIRDKARNPDLSVVFSPPEVTGLSGQYQSGAARTQVTGKIWSDEAWDWKAWGDFSRFEVHRGTGSDFDADQAHYLGQTNDYVYNDATAVLGTVYFYKWRAVNVNGIRGPESETIQVAAATTPSAVISGYVRTAAGTGIEGVTVTYSNGAGTAPTDEDGAYYKLVASGWSGTATPAKAGTVFSPASKSYTNVTTTRSDENFIGTAATYALSGTVNLASGGALGGVVLNGLPGNPQTNASGFYSVIVTHGWSGSTIPTKTGYSFTPMDRQYSSVTSNLPGQDFSATFTPNTLTLTSPNGGEVWEAGSAQSVAWTTTGTVGNVKIESSADNGQTWTTIAASAANTGSCPWTVPSAASANCLVRISQAAGGSPMDVSDQRFSITVPQLSSLALGASALRFGASAGGTKTSAQTLSIVNTGGGVLNWSAAAAGTPAFIQITPPQGLGNALIQVSVDPAGLAPGTYTGRIAVSAPNATNSPQNADVTLTVFDAGATGAPFGTMDTPTDGASGIEGAFPVMGWALDDVEVAGVKVWRDPVGGEATAPNGYVFIGDALFIDGARPDVEQAFPAYPRNTRGGWGYMLLSNFLPNGGNGTFRLHAIATDAEGRTTLLGSKTVTCDNAGAVLPFGTIDTPAQGGTAWGNAYVNFAWALTPLPKSIPMDGSSIWVWVDGLPLGHPNYNHFRDDIARLFPGLANSNGAIGYFVIDTTGYSDGLHTIAWSVRDSAGVNNGIGSRYFTVSNAAAGNGGTAGVAGRRPGTNAHFGARRSSADLAGIPDEKRPSLVVKRGFDPDAVPEDVPVGREGEAVIKVSALERIVVGFPERENGRRSAPSEAYLAVGEELRPLPAGSTFDPAAGVFSWQPGPGFLGEYRFVFVDGARGAKTRLTLTILPRD
jgi:hypothetical protein